MLNAVAKHAAVAEIHEKTLCLMQHTGVSFGVQSALELFRKHGFKVEGSWVTFTEQQIKEALAAVPGSFTVQGLTESASFGAGTINMAGCSGAVELLDAEGQARAVTREDFIRRQQLDATSSVVNIGDMDSLYVPELPPERELPVKAALALAYNPKPLIASCSTAASSRQTLGLARDFYQGAAEYYSVGVGNMVSPLQYSEENIGAMDVYAEFGQPLVLTCCSIPGLTSPITLSGTLVQNNAEVLAGIVYMQLLKPGLPMVYGNSTFGVDMRSANTAAGAFEAFLLIPYTAALARYYQLPCRVSGSLNDAKLLDYQSGMETALGLFYALGNNVDFIYHACGGLDGLRLFSFEKYLLDEELITRVLDAGGRDMLSGLEGSMQDLLALRDGVNFITCRQTRKEFKQQHFNPRLVNRERVAGWQKNGCPSVEYKAAQLLEQRLAQYQPPVLNASQQELVNAFIK